MEVRTNRTTVERHKAVDYLAIADSFYLGAELAAEFEHWNTAGVLIVHAAIAFADAVAIAIGGVKSRRNNHRDTIDLLDDLMPGKETVRTALDPIRYVIDLNEILWNADTLF